jgi:4-hydroxy-3-methylbut-2-enyl diphosphate reductase IspH
MFVQQMRSISGNLYRILEVIMTGNRIAFISGHTDIDENEFNEHYKQALDEAVENKDKFIMAAAYGADLDCLDYLMRKGVDVKDVTICIHDKYIDEKKKKFEEKGLVVLTGFPTHRERDQYMTEMSDYDIAWLRPVEEAKRKYGETWEKDQTSAVEHNLQRRANQNRI